MTEIYNFIYFIALGLVARLLYLAATALAKRTNLFPVTIVLDVLTALIVGGCFAAYVILTSATIAPYMFAALLAGYLFTYWVTKKATASGKQKKDKTAKKKEG